VVCLLKGIAEGTYKTKHAEAAKLYSKSSVSFGPTIVCRPSSPVFCKFIK
jgi:hypothetical protein